MKWAALFTVAAVGLSACVAPGTEDDAPPGIVPKHFEPVPGACDGSMFPPATPGPNVTIDVLNETWVQGQPNCYRVAFSNTQDRPLRLKAPPPTALPDNVTLALVEIAIQKLGAERATLRTGTIWPPLNEHYNTSAAKYEIPPGGSFAYTYSWDGAYGGGQMLLAERGEYSITADLLGTDHSWDVGASRVIRLV